MIHTDGYTIEMTDYDGNYILLSFAPSCPPIPLPGCAPGTGLWVGLPFFGMMTAGIVPGTGSVSVPFPLPPPGTACGLPVGLPIFAQWVNLGGGTLEATDALTFTIGQV